MFEQAEGYTDQEIIELDREWNEIVQREGLDKFRRPDEYEQRAKAFQDEVGHR